MRDVCWRLLVLTASLCLFPACEDQGTIKEDGTEVVWPAAPRDPNTYVCDPVAPIDPDSSTPSSDVNQGIIANLYYLPADAPHYSYVNDYMTYGLMYNNIDIYFNQLYVPTRPFDRGFTTEGGITLVTPEGDTLYEWFALEFRGKMHLNANQAPGDYQLALLADDGAILEIDTDNDGVYETLIDNDGFHPTKMGCALQPVTFDVNTEISYRLRYFQGPRYHISIVAMMRPWSSDPNVYNDPLCGQYGNSLFFDSTKSPPEPQSAFLALLSRDWEVLTPENYSLPDSETGGNPCNPPPDPQPEVAPVLTNFNISNITQTTLTVTWDSDISSTSQVQLLDVLTGTVILTTEDSNLVTTHGVFVTGLKSNTLYDVSAVSKNASGLSTITTPVSIRTSR